MKKQWDYGRCVSVLGQEIALFKKISAVQDSVRQAVLAREWADFDWKMAEINQLGMEFSSLEQERAGLFACLIGEKAQNQEETAFYALVARLPEDERRELSGLYRTLKMEAIKTRAMNEAFLNYLGEAKTMAAAYLEAVYPARGGKLYTSKGAEASKDLKSMVFNRHI
ncbi:hypothetical protein [Leadbettera azotonutricia]|uniref:Flagellar protein FlgN n=1 Tax=Leadbettera azotonutricia (strain ATCC BAA-888 / DSM 13862 / ZAS-9) TaxID=545695 RepID=F5YDK0_LEAAZ|nr:hypothetical protein [Leadbettera azotonutricia]AEF80885.1 hypothetical protein TREAZ_0326 [Leadbettera azotonutricia ZAS-9]